MAEFLDNLQETCIPDNPVYRIIDYSIKAAYLGCAFHIQQEFEGRDDFETWCWIEIVEELEKGRKGVKKSYNYQTSLDVFLRHNVIGNALLKLLRSKYGRKDVSQKTNASKRALANTTTVASFWNVWIRRRAPK